MPKVMSRCKPSKSFQSKIGRLNIREEMYNTMNSYYKYTSIPKSFFNKINILILPMSTGKKYLKHSIHIIQYV